MRQPLTKHLCCTGKVSLGSAVGLSPQGLFRLVGSRTWSSSGRLQRRSAWNAAQTDPSRARATAAQLAGGVPGANAVAGGAGAPATGPGALGRTTTAATGYTLTLKYAHWAPTALVCRTFSAWSDCELREPSVATSLGTRTSSPRTWCRMHVLGQCLSVTVAIVISTGLAMRYPL